VFAVSAVHLTGRDYQVESPGETVRKELRALARILWVMNVERPDLRRQFWVTVIDCLRYRARNFEAVLTMSVMYLHLGAFAQVLVSDLDRQIAELDIGVLPEAPLVPAAQTNWVRNACCLQAEKSQGTSLSTSRANLPSNTVFWTPHEPAFLPRDS
jgi:hypothetical protein